MSRFAVTSSCGIPGADHDRGQFRPYTSRNCPRSWNRTTRGRGLQFLAVRGDDIDAPPMPSSVPVRDAVAGVKRTTDIIRPTSVTLTGTASGNGAGREAGQ
jgi:hypothetical protein